MISRRTLMGVALLALPLHRAGAQEVSEGIDGQVSAGNRLLRGWQLAGLPLDPASFTELDRRSSHRSGNGMLFRADFVLPKERVGTYIDMRAWRKGYVWVNGHLLGRYWHVGPQQRLYCPDAFPEPGKNGILILDTEQMEPAAISGAATLA